MIARVLSFFLKNKSHLAFLACLSSVLLLVLIIQKNSANKVECQKIGAVCVENFYLKIHSKVQGRFSDYLNEIRKYERLHNYNKKWFPGTFIHDGQEQEAKFRVRGDLHTHYRGNQVSLRVKVKENKLKPARQLNFIVPWDKDYAIEPLSQIIAGELGIFSNVGHFGKLSFIAQKSESDPYYYIDEHLSKELLESKGYYSAPVFTFGTLWTELSDSSQHYFLGSSEMRDVQKIRNNIFQIDVRKTYNSSSKKAVLMQTAIIKRLWEASYDKKITDDNKELIKQYLDVSNFEKFIAVQCFFGSDHALNFNDNTRLYYNPKSTKFELFMWDVSLMDLENNKICMNILKSQDSPYYDIRNNPFSNLVSNGILSRQNIRGHLAFLLERQIHYKSYLENTHNNMKRLSQSKSFHSLPRKSRQISKGFDRNIKFLSYLLEN